MTIHTVSVLLRCRKCNHPDYDTLTVGGDVAYSQFACEKCGDNENFTITGLVAREDAFEAKRSEN